MQIVNVKESGVDEAVRKATQVLQNGGIVLFPTDTIYGLAVDALNIRAVHKLIDLKGREASKAISVVLKDKETIDEYAVVDNVARKLINEFLPGALTLILETKDHFGLLSADGTVGIRMPDDPFVRALSEIYPNPFTATSANLSGQPTAANVEDILKQFGERAGEIELAIDEGDRVGHLPSTVVRVRDGKAEILRQGAIPREKLDL